MLRPWIYLENPMLNATANSYLLAMRISTLHDGALKAASDTLDPFFVAMYAFYHPLHVDYQRKYDAWVAQGGLQQGETLNITQLLKLESGTKARVWDNGIQAVYDISTTKYKGIFPNHREPFQNGTQTQRIDAVKALSTAIGTDPLLATVKSDVDAFYTLINTAIAAQKGAISMTGTDSDAVETTRVNMCVGQYADLGGLIQHFASKPELINQYFDLAALRNPTQVFFTGHVKAQKVHTIMKHTFGAADHVKLENPGTTELHFYSSGTKNAQQGTTFITVLAGKEVTVLASQLGALTDPYMMVFNPDDSAEGEFTVEIV